MRDLEDGGSMILCLACSWMAFWRRAFVLEDLDVDQY